MFNFYKDCTFAGSSSFNWVSILAVLISAFSIGCTLYFVYLNKRVELLNAKFQKFCIAGLDQNFKRLDDQLQTVGISNITLRPLVIDTFLDVQLFITALKPIYPNIDTEALIEEIEKMTDSLFPVIPPVFEIKLNYIKLRLQIYSKLYDFALSKELSLFFRLGLKKHKPVK